MRKNKNMKISYDSEADALYMGLKKGKVAHTKREGDYLFDYDDKGNILGIEVLWCSEKFSPEFEKEVALKHAV